MIERYETMDLSIGVLILSHQPQARLLNFLTPWGRSLLLDRMRVTIWERNFSFMQENTGLTDMGMNTRDWLRGTRAYTWDWIKDLGLIISFTHETAPFLSIHFLALALMLVREREESGKMGKLVLVAYGSPRADRGQGGLESGQHNTCML